jgi:hypothetical protein
MSLTNYKEAFDNTYQEVFQKVLVAKEVASFRFEPVLKFGESVERVAYDITGVAVRTVTRGSASTIDSVTDTSELLEINLEKEAVFHISDGEVTQAGPLNPGEVIGAKIAHKVAEDFDGRVFGQVPNALYAFDTGDLTTGVSSNVPITLSSTTVPQMAARMPAKLRSKNNQVLSNLVFVLDSYAASDVTQYLLGKNIDLAGSTFANGYTGDVSNARMYVSENLTARAHLALATNPTDGDTITYNGVTVTFVATLSGGESEIHICSTVDITRANLVEWLNAGGANAEAEATDTGYSAATAADQALLTGITAENNNTDDVASIVQVGAGRVAVSETLTDGTDTWTLNAIHCYFGKKGGIEAVLQDMKKVDMRPTDDRRGTNVFSSYLGGVKTFADGAKMFLDVRISA